MNNDLFFNPLNLLVTETIEARPQQIQQELAAWHIDFDSISAGDYLFIFNHSQDTIEAVMQYGSDPTTDNLDKVFQLAPGRNIQTVRQMKTKPGMLRFITYPDSRFTVSIHYAENYNHLKGKT